MCKKAAVGFDFSLESSYARRWLSKVSSLKIEGLVAIVSTSTLNFELTERSGRSYL